MKKRIALLLALVMLLSLSACGKKKTEEAEESPAETAPVDSVFEVNISLNNLYQYFE